MKTDVEACKILADKGIDVEKLQKELPDEFLSQIGGAYVDWCGVEIHCPTCGNADKNELSFQVIATLYAFKTIYRCRKCGNLLSVDIDGFIEHYDH